MPRQVLAGTSVVRSPDFCGASVPELLDQMGAVYDVSE
jgi:hypothetical protein